MTDQLLAYVLDQLDEHDKADFEARLQSDPGLRRQADLMREALEPLAADREDNAPPPGLAVRTIARVAEHLCRRQELPKAPVDMPQPVSVGRAWWSRADVLMAATLLIAIFGLGVF